MKDSKKLIILISLIVILIVSVIVYYSYNSASEIIKIGAILPLTGDFGYFGQEVSKGIMLFEKEHEEEFRTIIEDDKGDSKESITAFRKLKDINNVGYFYGPFGPVSSQSVYSSQSNQDKIDVIFIAMSMCAEDFEDYENMLCNYPTPYYQLKESFEFVESINKRDYYAIIANDAMGEMVKENLIKLSEELSLNLLGVEKVNINNKDFKTTIVKVKKEGSDFIYIFTGSPPTNFKIVKELKEMDYKGMIIIGSDIDEKQVNEFKNILEGVYFFGIAKIEFDDSFVELYKTEYGDAPNVYSAYGYLWMDTFYNAIKNKKGRKVDADDIVNYVGSHRLIIKDLKYNKDKQVEFPMKVLKVENSKLKEVFVSG